MHDQLIQSFVDKLILLEQKTGHKVTYRMMHPLTGPFSDCVTFQKLAKEIADFIGLEGFTFIVATAKQKENVGGHIDLSTCAQEVFIEVDADVKWFPDAVAAIVCHELCHKWLQVNAISSHSEIDNEILTDITSVYLGLGRIMLNGCRVTDTKQQAVDGGTQTTTRTISTGYLDRNQLAFVYRLVCAMRRIPPSDFMQGLNAEAALAVDFCDSTYGRHCALSFRRIEATQEPVADFENRAVEVQRTLADLNKHITYIKNSLCETIDEFLIGGHRTLASLQRKVLSLMQSNEVDPALRFLRAIQSDFDVNLLIDKINSVSREAEGLLHHAKEVGLHLSRNKQCFPAPSSAMFNIVTCPVDGVRFGLPENSSDLIATCPVCKYSFAYNTSVVSFSEPPASRGLAWWQRIANVMRPRRRG